MENTFYTSFDTELWATRSSDYRTPFQQDRDRIIYSSAFRRLQAKTQVFFSGEYDFYRTRLTHSIEVAQIGRSICNHLRRNGALLADDFYVDPDLVEAICLAHDIGHPPFGHAGERALNKLMRNYGGFEGNAQTLRIITEIIYPDNPGRRGMSPTRALVDGVLKYKALHKQLEEQENHFLYDDQEDYLRFVFDDRAVPPELSTIAELNRFRSIECGIMDWADDTAYSTNDLADGVRAGFITAKGVEQWAEEHSLEREENRFAQQLLEDIRAGNADRRFSRQIGEFIKACSVSTSDNFMSDRTHRYHYRLVVDDEARKKGKLYKKIARDLVFGSPQVHQLEYKGSYILSHIFEALAENYIRQDSGRKGKFTLLPEDVEHAVRSETLDSYRARVLCDYVAGMTDGFAVRTYKRLFDPDYGSILDLV